MAGRMDDRKQFRCSFCNKTQDQVRKLIAGPKAKNVYICDECIEICSEIIADEFVPYENQDGINLLKPKEIKEFYEQMELDDKEKLKPIELVIEKTFKKDFDIKYNKEANHRTHMTVILNRRLKQVERSILPNKIKAEQYHIEIIEKEEKTIINIYNEKNDLELNMR